MSLLATVKRLRNAQASRLNVKNEKERGEYEFNEFNTPPAAPDWASLAASIAADLSHLPGCGDAFEGDLGHLPSYCDSQAYRDYKLRTDAAGAPLPGAVRSDLPAFEGEVLSLPSFVRIIPNREATA